MKKVITLIGMPGVGKSTIGKLLADRLCFGFLDLDDLIKEREGKTHVEILEDRGDEALIQIETSLALALDLSALAESKNGLVFAPGGSIIYSPATMEKLKKESVIFFLDLPFFEIKKRLSFSLRNRGIVGLARTDLWGIFNERLPLYQGFASHTINCYNAKDEEVVEEIINILSSRFDLGGERG